MVLLASEYDQSRFLKADDLDGGERKFKIKNVTAEDLGGDGKLIVWFTNDKKGLILNKTNNRVLRTAFGDDTAGWKDQIIILFSMMVSMQGRMVPGLRVRIPPPRQASTKPASATFMSRGRETQPLGNGPVAAKPANKKSAKKKKPPADELDEVIESQPPPQDSGDDFNDDIDL
jgi:hypothetical protein